MEVFQSLIFLLSHEPLCIVAVKTLQLKTVLIADFCQARPPR